MGITLENDLATKPARLGADVDDVVGCPDDLLVMLDDDDRIAQVPQLLEYPYQQVGIPRVEPDTWLIKDIERADEAAAQRGGQVDPLALTTGEGR